jgi:hypothetical protein
MVAVADAAGGAIVRARVHDRKSPSLPTEWRSVTAEWSTTVNGVATRATAKMQWYGEYLWRAAWPADVPASATYRVCATDAAGNAACKSP